MPGLELAPVSRECPVSGEQCVFFGNVATGRTTLGISTQEVISSCALSGGAQREAGEPCPAELFEVRLRGEIQ